MQFRGMLLTATAAVVLAVTGGCSTSSSNSASSDGGSDVVLGSSGLPSSGSDSDSASESSYSSLTASALPSTDTVPQVPSGAVMAATVIVDSGQFKGTSKIRSTGTVGCSYSLFGDNQWRINFSSEGEFASKDTTDSGRDVIAFGVTAKNDGSAEIGVTFTDSEATQDLEDQQGYANVVDNGMAVTFTYVGRNPDGTLFHGAALCTKPLRSQ